MIKILRQTVFNKVFFSALLLSHSLSTSLAAEGADEFGKIQHVPSPPSPHWLWVYDPNFISFSDGRAHLIDGDTGKYLGTLNTGYVHLHLTLPSHYKEIYSAETYYSRHVGGVRTDLVRIYDPVSLSLLGEIDIPDKRAAVFPRLHNAALTADDKFMLVFNLTPATSVSVVNTETRQFVAEINTPGCSLLLTAGGYRFLAVCADGTALKLTLAKNGKEAVMEKSPAFFDMSKDPVSESPIRYQTKWLFPSLNSFIYAIDTAKETLGFAKPWSLLTAKERANNWRVGGSQQITINEPHGLLYAIMHQGPADTVEGPGPEVWVYDIAKQHRVWRIKTNNDVISIHVSPDEKPLLFTIVDSSSTIDIYDALTSQYLRSVTELGVTPWSMQTPPVQLEASHRGKKQ